MNNLEQWFLTLSLLDKYFRQVAVGQFELSFEGFRLAEYHAARTTLVKAGAQVLYETFDRQTGKTVIRVKQPI